MAMTNMVAPKVSVNAIAHNIDIHLELTEITRSSCLGRPAVSIFFTSVSIS